MIENRGHIISKFLWDTSFDSKERVGELQDHLSAIGKQLVEKEIMAAFDAVCPPEQTWKIQSIELELGSFSLESLATDLPPKLSQQLKGKLIEISSPSNRGDNNIEVLQEYASSLEVLQHFLLNGFLPWNYNPKEGTINQILKFLLKNKKEETLTLIRRAGNDQNIRKRMAWQFNANNLREIIKGLEPYNYPQVFRFKVSFLKIWNAGRLPITTNLDIDKQLSFWILNHLLIERGVLFKYKDFVTDNIAQMADHFSMDFETLFDLLDLEHGDQTGKMFLSKKKESATILTQDTTRADNEYNWALLERLFKDNELRKQARHKKIFNELISGLHGSDKKRFCALLTTLGTSDDFWREVVRDSKTANLELILEVLFKTEASSLVKSTRFLQHLLKKEKHFNCQDVWHYALTFALRYQNTAYHNTSFFNYFLLAHENKSFGFTPALLTKLWKDKIASSFKTTENVTLYQDLATILSSEPNKEEGTIAQQFVPLIDALCFYEVSSEENRILVQKQKEFTKWLRLYPGKVFDLLLQYSNRRQLLRVIPLLMDAYDVAYMLKSSKGGSASMLLSLYNGLNEFKGAVKSPGLAKTVCDHVIISGLQLLIADSEPKTAVFIRTLVRNLRQILRPQQETVLNRLLHKFLEKLNIQNEVLRKSLATVIKEDTGRPPLLRTIEIMVSFADRQYDVCKIIKHSKAWPVADLASFSFSSKGKQIITYLAPKGVALLNTLLKHFTQPLKEILKEPSKEQIDREINQIYWQCLLDYSLHRGDDKSLFSAFKKAFSYQFPKSSVEDIREQAWEVNGGTRVAYFSTNNGSKVGKNELYALIRKGLKASSENLNHNGYTYSLKELLLLGMEVAPREMLNIMKTSDFSEKYWCVLKSHYSYEHCISILASYTENPQISKDLFVLKSLFSVVKVLLGDHKTEVVQDPFWRQTLQLIKLGYLGNNALNSLIKLSFGKIREVPGVSPVLLSHQIQHSGLQIPAVLKDGLVRQSKVFLSLSNLQEFQPPIKELRQCARNEKMEALCHYILVKRDIPWWFSNSKGRSPNQILKQILAHYPVTLFATLKARSFTNTQLGAFCQMMPIKDLIAAICYLNPALKHTLARIATCYNAFGHITHKDIAAEELQQILYKKMLLAWRNDNWKLLSSKNIWKELQWEVCVKRGISKTSFGGVLEEIKSLLPPSFQLSLDHASRPILKLERQQDFTEELKIKELLYTAGINSPLKDGIAVKNAGVVLLNSYIPMLLERLELLKEGVFKNQNLQKDAIHYLQYLVTGQSYTQEAFLPLNKVLCGLDLTAPVPDGIVLSEAHEEIICGLITAASQHWDCIGDTSVDGFRGNWLVRDGILIEDTDRWELIVEKRSYDLLINRSPFSFSIIKYPWMHKPLHVKWPY